MNALLRYGGGYIFSMLISDVIFFTATTYLIWSLLKPLYEQRKISLQIEEIAGSPPKHWFYGHFPQCSSDEKGTNWIIDKIKQYPVMMNFWATPTLSFLNLHHPDSVSAYVNSGAPKNNSTYRMLKSYLGDGLLLSSGKKWLRNRRLLTPAFHYTILKSYTKIFNDSVAIMLNKWENNVGKNIEISNDVSLMTLDTMLKCAMSSDLNPQESNDHPYLQAMRRYFELYITRCRTPLHYFDWIYKFTKNGKEFYKCIEILHNQTEMIIAKRKDELRKNKCSNALNSKHSKILDFLDMLLQTKDEDGNGLTDLEIRDEVDTFLFEGHDTTASGIQWAFHNLAKYPKFQEKCRQEINDVVGDKENVEWSDIPNLEYLTMFLKESLRMNSPVYAIGRKLDKTMDIHSLMTKHEITTLPKDAVLTLMIYGLHKNPYIWEDPQTFDPERFNKENSSKRSPYAYLPFSAGSSNSVVDHMIDHRKKSLIVTSRNCIGQNFAMNEMKIVLAQTIRTFRLSIKDDTPESKTMRMVTLKSESGVHIHIEHYK